MTKYKKNGKKLGVLGGMGPAAAAEFLRQLAAKCGNRSGAPCGIYDRGL